MISLCAGTVLTALSPDSGDQVRFRVVWETDARIALFRIDLTHGVPFWRSRSDVVRDVEEGVLKLSDNCLVPLLSTSEPTDKARAIRERRWKVIKDLVTPDPSIGLIPPALVDSVRGSRIAAAAADHGVTRARVYGWLRLYWAYGPGRDCLLGRFDLCGAPGKPREPGSHKRGRPPAGEKQGVNVTPAAAKLLVLGARQFHERQRLPFPEAHAMTLQKYFNQGVRVEGGVTIPIMPPLGQLPTEAQQRYYYEQSKRAGPAIRARRGAEAYERDHRPILGVVTSYADGVGAVFELDATKSDLQLIARNTLSQSIGRATLYEVVDVWSSMTVGFYIGLEEASWRAASLALECAFTDKVQFCQRYAITIPAEAWPCAHTPARLMGDRGGELLGDSAEQAAQGLGYDLLNAPPRRGDRKATVERRLGLDNQCLQRQPGGIRRDADRTDPNPQTEAVYDFYSLNRLMIVHTLKRNHRPIQGRPLPVGYPPEYGQPAPIDLWNWGQLHGRCHLQVQHPDLVRQYLLPSTMGVLTPRGIRIEGLHYTAESLDAEELFSRRTGRGTRSVPCCWDPGDRGIAYLRPPREPMIRLSLTARDEVFLGMTQTEVAGYHRALQVGTDDRRNHDFVSSTYFSSLEAHIQAEAVSRRDAMVLERGEIAVKDIRHHRAAERQVEQHTLLGLDQSPREESGDSVVYVPPSRYEYLFEPNGMEPGS